MADDYIKLANQGAKRNLDINPQLRQALSFLPELGVTAEVFSGGQSSKEEFANGTATSKGYTGSTRHVHGKAGDFFFYRNGKRLDWANPQDLPIFEEIVRRAKANGVTGFGAGSGYMQPGSMHLGFGTPGVWGSGGSGDNAAQWLRNAYNSAGQGSIPVDQEAALAGGVNAGGGQQPDQLMTSPSGTPGDDWTQTMGGPSADVMPRSGPEWNDVAWAVHNSLQTGQYGAWLTLDKKSGLILRWNGRKQRALSKEQADAYDRFLGLVRREVNRTILEPSPNAIKRNFSGPLAGLVMQLKSYMLNALAVNTAGAIKLGPAYLAMSLLTTSTWGAAVYAAQQYVNSFGRDDQDEFLEDRLSASGILAGGFQRSAVSSIFPMIIDSMAGAYGVAVSGEDERFFTNTRSSGLGSDLFSGIPMVGTINDAGKLLSGAAAAALRNDQRLDETEARGFRDFVPLARSQLMLQATNEILKLAPADTDGAAVRTSR